MRLTLSAALALAAAAPPAAAVEPSPLFGDNAVLQADRKIPVWGTGTPGRTVTVLFCEDGDGGACHTYMCPVDSNGKWRVNADPLKAGTRLTLKFDGGGDLIESKNVVVGEAWLCSGQSNMAWPVRRAMNFDKEQKAAKYPDIRMFTVPRRPATEPREDLAGKWVVCSPETVANFSATAYFFGRRLRRELKRPVGLINSSVGGTAVEAWTSMGVQKGDSKLKPIFDRWAKINQRKNANHPANLYNGMIQPLLPYAIRGAIWYQGERNARSVESAQLYAHQLPLMIKDWRKRWGYEFPFLFVQLPNFKKRSDGPGGTTAWAEIRESFRQVDLSVPKTGMAVTIDVGQAKNIHPENKQAVGKRLAGLALADVYEKDVPARGPVLKAATKQGDAYVVKFSHVGDGLKGRGGELKGFAVQDQAGKWHWATAEITGRDTVKVSHAGTGKLAGLRYAWGDNPECNLINSANLPASPFQVK